MARPKVQQKPAPRHVIEQLRAGEILDVDALTTWYVDHCPTWLKLSGCPVDVAALLSTLPDPARWAHAQMVGK